MWCWRRMENGWADLVRNGEVLREVKEDRNIIHTVSTRKVNLIRHILLRNWLLKHVTEEKIEGGVEVTGR
jgi:hypothetical protein